MQLALIQVATYSVVTSLRQIYSSSSTVFNPRHNFLSSRLQQHSSCQVWNVETAAFKTALMRQGRHTNSGTTVTSE